MKKIFVILILVLPVIFFASSCTKTNPTVSIQPTVTPTATQTGLFVESANIIQSQSSNGVGDASAIVVLRHGNATGSYVSGANVTLGTYTFSASSTGTYDFGSSGTYKATIANIGDGQALSLSINSTAGNATASINAPWSAEITTPSTDGTNQSAAATRQINWRYWIIIAGTYPQKVEIIAWRSSDSTIYFKQQYTPAANGEYITLPINILPTTGQIYFRSYGINSSTITGVNAGSAKFIMYNSENTHYVNMTQ
jgi:hypothetical protein